MTDAGSQPPHMYRIGVVGPPSTGKSLLLSGFRKVVDLACPICSLEHARAEMGPSVDESLHDASRHSTDVFSVVVKEKGTLGIKIAKHKKYAGFVCVKAFVKDESSGEKFELERSGKVCPGDLLVAVNRQSLMNVSAQDITRILKNDSEIRVLTFLRIVGTDLSGTSLDASVSSALGSISGGGEGDDSSCSTWRTAAKIDNLSYCLEIVEIPGINSSLSLLRSHVSGLDGLVFVYSLEMMSSLLMLEKRYARAFPGILPAKSKARGIEDFPVVVVGTGRKSAVEDSNPSLRSKDSQKQMLLAEGNAFAEVWGAAPVVEAHICSSGETPDDAPAQLIEIFRKLIHRIDACDDPSCFVDNDGPRGLGLSCFFPLCFGDSAVSESDSAVDTSIDATDETIKDKKNVIIARRRKDTRKLRAYSGFEGGSSARAVSSVLHPSEELPSGMTSTKVLRYILSSCE